MKQNECSLRVDFENRQDLVPVTYRLKMLIRRAIRETLDYEQYRNPAEVSVTLTDNAQIRELNRRFRQVDRATDVLSFPLFDYSGEQDEPPVDELVGMLGDIVISLEQAGLQAAEYGHSPEREGAFLCVHAMLHLLGYDHENGGLALVRMREKEEYVMRELGLPASSSYAPDA